MEFSERALRKKLPIISCCFRELAQTTEESVDLQRRVICANSIISIDGEALGFGVLEIMLRRFDRIMELVSAVSTSCRLMDYLSDQKLVAKSADRH